MNRPNVPLEVKYLHHATRGKIVRMRRNDGYRCWRIARDCGLPVEVVMVVLADSGFPWIVLERKEEQRA